MELDALPDELLVEIFSLLDDGVLLLDCVSLVCKRWRRLAQDWRSWTGVRLEFEDHNWRFPPEDVDTLDKARVLLHAPLLGCLTVDLFSRPDRQGARMFESAVRRSHAMLFELEIYSSNLSADVREALYGLLWRNRDHLRVMRPELPLDWDPFFHHTDSEDEIDESEDYVDTNRGEPITVTLDGEEMSLMDILAHLQRLERLSLDIYPAYEYIGEMRGERLPRLNELDLNFSDRLEKLDLAVDLVNAGSESLRTLKLPVGHGMILTQLLDAVSGCAGLRRLQIGYVDLPLVANLHHLASLEVRLPQWSCWDTMIVEKLATTRRVVSEVTVVLGGLSELSLEGYYKDSHYFENTPGLQAKLRAELLLLITETLRASRNVTSLTLWGDVMFKEVLAELPAFVPRVRRLWLSSRCSPDSLAACSLLPELRKLTVHWGSDADQAEEEVAARKAAVEEFRRLRPDVELKLL